MRALLEMMDSFVGSDEKRWVTIHGRPVYLGATYDEKQLKALDPKREGSAFIPEDKRKEPDLNKDGKQKEKNGKPLFKYTKEWRLSSAKYKYARTAALERIRGAIEKDLRSSTKSKEMTNDKAIGTAMLIMAKTGIRAGGGALVFVKEGTKNVLDADGNKVTIRHYGLSSVRKKHVSISGNKVTMKFLGKSGVDRTVEVEDKDIADSVRQFLGGDSSPGDESDLWPNEKGLKPDRKVERMMKNMVKRVKKHDTNLVSKDFRTAVAMHEASKTVLSIMDKKIDVHKDPAKAAKQAKEMLRQVGNAVSKKLGNKPDVALQNYTSPELMEYMLESLGFTADSIDANRKSFEESKSMMDMGHLSGRKTPILDKLLGREAVEKWLDVFALNNEDSADRPDDILSDNQVEESGEFIGSMMLEEVMRLAGL